MPATYAPYDLVAVTGTSPAVVTETIYALARQTTPPMRPRRVVLVTTAVGHRFIQARLLGTPGLSTRRQTLSPEGQIAERVEPIDPRAVWDDLGPDLFGAPLPPPEVHTIAVDGAPVDDIATDTDAAACRDALYAHLHALTQDEDEDAVPVVVSLAGGRKTMSGDVQTAFSLWARPQDRLVHVLVREAFEHRDFFYPRSDADRAHDAHARIVSLVDTDVPRLRRLLQKSRIARAHAEGNARAVFATLSPANYRRVPTDVVIRLGDGPKGRASLLFQQRTPAGVTELGHFSLATANTATLLAFADALCGPTAPASVSIEGPDWQETGPQETRALDTWFRTSTPNPARARRLAVYDASGGVPPPGKFRIWSSNADVQKNLDALNTELQKLPLAEDALTIEKDARPGHYGFRRVLKGERPLAVHVHVGVDGYAEADWPFDRLPLHGAPAAR